MSSPYAKLFERTTQGIKPGLEVVAALLDALGNPHRRLAIVHVAGTNGKGSVCAMLEAVLRASGFKTGLYTSPHLVDFSERFRINGARIPEQALERYILRLEEVAAAVESATGLRPATFFEISTAIAFQYFADERVDLAIVETGMGGRWDATNVVIPLVSAITRIDIDHAEYLGGTLEAIAAEKAGIIKPGRPAVSAPQAAEVLAVLERAGQPVLCSAEAVSIARMPPDRAGTACGKPVQRLKIETPSRSLPPVRLPLLGECQRENCGVAVAVLEILADLLGFEPAYRQGLESVEWAARFEVLQAAPPVVLDGAHNPSGARALAATLREAYPKHQVGFILGFLGDKDALSFLRIVKPLAARAWMIGIDAPRGLAAEESAALALGVGLDAAAGPAAAAWDAARAWAAAGPGRLVCAAGSLYLKQMLAAAGCLGE